MVTRGAVDAIPSPENAGTSPLMSALARVERRIETGRLASRDGDEAFRGLCDQVGSSWPPEGAEGVRLAARMLRTLGSWRERDAWGEPLDALAESVLVALRQSLLSLDPADRSLGPVLLEVWKGGNDGHPGRREALVGLLTECLPGPMAEALDVQLTADLFRGLGHPGTATLIRGRGAGPIHGRRRDSALLLARLRIERGLFERAREVLEREGHGDPRIHDVEARALLAEGRVDEAIDKLRRALVVLAGDDRAAAEQRLLGLLLTRQSWAEAVDVAASLWATTGRLCYWHHVVEAAAPRGAAAVVREHVRTVHAPMWAGVQMERDDVAGVVATLQAKSFSADQLWSVGTWLQDRDTAEAERTFERALLLHAARVGARGPHQELVGRVEAVRPFFDRIGKPLKLRRIAREVVARTDGNQPVRRDLERLFEVRF